MPTLRQKTTAMELNGDFGKFKDFMRRLVAVPHSEIKAAMEAEKTRKKSSSVSPAAASATKS